MFKTVRLNILPNIVTAIALLLTISSCNTDSSDNNSPVLSAEDPTYITITEDGCRYYDFSSSALRVFDVGPGKTYSTINEVVEKGLQAGDVVRVYWKSEPYREKIFLPYQGTSGNPIVLMGVPGENCTLPVINGENAISTDTVRVLSAIRGIVIITDAENDYLNPIPQWIYIANFNIKGARPDNQFSDYDGTSKNYTQNAAAVFVGRGENIHLYNNEINDAGNGLFVYSANHTDLVSKNILIEGNYFYDNGTPGTDQQHSTYTEALGIIYQYNRFDPQRTGASGNSIKDRSAGTVIRYNWIDGGNRCIDLVDAEDSNIIVNDPSYRKSFVYGNIMIKRLNAGKDFVHYGGDSDPSIYRNGILHLYNNTMITYNDENFGENNTNETLVVRLNTDNESADIRNNIIYHAGVQPSDPMDYGNPLCIKRSEGVVNLKSNWLSTGWQLIDGDDPGGDNPDPTQFSGYYPGFNNFDEGDYFLKSTSDLIGKSSSLHSDVLPDHNITKRYKSHRAYESRVAPLSVGAF